MTNAIHHTQSHLHHIIFIQTTIQYDNNDQTSWWLIQYCCNITQLQYLGEGGGGLDVFNDLPAIPSEYMMS